MLGAADARPACPEYTAPTTPAVQRAIADAVITFDAGQTLVELDLDFLARRLGGARGRRSRQARWKRPRRRRGAHYDALVEAGAGHPWRALMTALLDGCGCGRGRGLVDWLWSEQPRANLWRRPIAGMVELARELRARGMRVAVAVELGRQARGAARRDRDRRAFELIVDSGRLGIEKPDPTDLRHTLGALGVHDAEPAIHIGDSWAADIAGALGAGWRAIWYGRAAASQSHDPRVAVARDRPRHAPRWSAGRA